MLLAIRLLGDIMLEQRLDEVLQKHNVHLNAALKSDLSSLFLAASQTMMNTLDLTIFDNLLSEENTKTMLTERAGCTLNVSKTISFEEDNSEQALMSIHTPSIGHYDDLGKLGVGGMGEVRKIRDRTLNRTLAMKIIHPNLLSKQNVTSRFIEEAQIGAQLQHPNIVPVHELGKLDDGRLYFTMKEVKGRPFGEAIAEVHAATENKRWRTTASGWSLRRLIDAFHDVCRAVAYAHSKGVLHRDLKPENIMLGEYGEVLVVDWGIAKVLGRRDLASETEEQEVISTNRSEAGINATRVGQVAGTPAYMSPEQARGEIDKLDERTDVYALGAILYEILTGHPAYMGGSGLEVLQKVLSGPPVSIRTTNTFHSDAADFVIDERDFFENVDHIEAPEELIQICERAMRREQLARYSGAAELAQAISDWLDGSKKREQGLKVVAEACELIPSREKLEQEAKILLQTVEQGLKDVPSWETEEVKGEWWKKEEKAKALLQQAQVIDIVQEQLLEAALTHKSDLEEAHLALAERYRFAHEQAETEKDSQKMSRAELRLREHAASLPDGHPKRIAHLEYLDGSGAVSLCTALDGVEVLLEQYVPHHRRLVPKLVANLGMAPIVSHKLAMGSYRIRLRKKGCHEVFYPVHIGRGEHWDGLDPDGIQQPIALPKLGCLDADDCYVPAGWFWAGGDQKGVRVLPRKRIWVDSFVIKKFPVTNREYLAFLNYLVRNDREEEALRWVPRERGGNLGQLGTMIYGRAENGAFILVPDVDGDMWELDWPVIMVDWHCAAAYSAWKAQQSGLSWRLLHELEWEKGARGVDGRFFVWGDGFDPSYGCMRKSQNGRTIPITVDSFPIDESVYGIRGLAGNSCDWTGSAWVEDGTQLIENERVIVAPVREEVSPESYWTNRGGSWYFNAWGLRAANRDNNISVDRDGSLGFRIGRSVQF